MVSALEDNEIVDKYLDDDAKGIHTSNMVSYQDQPELPADRAQRRVALVGCMNLIADIFDKDLPPILGECSYEDLWHTLMQIIHKNTFVSRRDSYLLKVHYGLRGHDPRPFSQLGADFRITTERVRQIVVRCITKIQQDNLARLTLLECMVYGERVATEKASNRAQWHPSLEELVNAKIEDSGVAEQTPPEEYLGNSINNLYIHSFVHIALQKANFHSIEEIEFATDDELLAIQGLGKKSVKDIREAIQEWYARENEFQRKMIGL